MRVSAAISTATAHQVDFSRYILDRMNPQQAEAN